jgi:hypothetical protein
MTIQLSHVHDTILAQYESENVHSGGKGKQQHTNKLSTLLSTDGKVRSLKESERDKSTHKLLSIEGGTSHNTGKSLQVRALTNC